MGKLEEFMFGIHLNSKKQLTLPNKTYSHNYSKLPGKYSSIAV